jgi:hypothetical protein
MENASNFIYVNKTDIFHRDRDIYVFYDEPQELRIAPFITTPTPSAAVAAPSPAFIT